MNSRKSELYTLLFLLFIFGVVTFAIIQDFISYLLLGGLLGFVFFPLYSRLTNNLGQPLSAFLVLSFAVLVLVIPFILVVYHVSTQAISFFSENSFSQITEQLSNVVSQNVLGVELAPVLEQLRSRIVGLLSTGAFSIAGAISSAILGIFITLFTMYYTLVDGNNFVLKIKGVLPLKENVKSEIFKEMAETTTSVVKGQLFVALIQGVLGGIGFLIFGIEGALIGGFFTFIAALVPGIGTPLVWLPVGLYQIFIGNFMIGVGFLVYSALVVGAADNILRPYIVGRQAKIHPLSVLLGVLGGIVVFGFVGLFIGPLIVSITMSLLNVFKEHSKHLTPR